MLALVTAVHLAALSQIESGDNDKAVGAAGELTRYQIGKAELRDWPMLELHPECEPLARQVTISIWTHRIYHFEAQHDRKPTVKEIYILWNSPAEVLHPSKVVLERAERFENLYRKGRAAR